MDTQETKMKIGLFVIGAAALIIMPFGVGALAKPFGLMRKNFRGDEIPTAFGLVIVLWSGAAIGIRLLSTGHRPEAAAHLALIVGMGILGLLDDLRGNRSVSGIRGHFTRAIHGEITTGFVKAVGGLALAITVPRFILQLSWPDSLLNGGIIALSANALNLMDLRPGRACAVFVVFACPLAYLSYKLSSHELLLVLIPTVVVYERDARGKAMVGDTGSNPLGASLGLAFTLVCSTLAARLGILAALVAMHVIAERISISEVIEKSAILRRIDSLTGIR